MARIFCFLLLAIHLISFTVSGARNVPTVTPPSSKNYTYVCNAQRYSDLGLDMSEFAFCNSALSYEERAMHLVSQMTLREKAQQLGNKAFGVPRLGLPKYNWWSEALHGVSNTGPGTFFDDVVPGATSFPTVILTTASFNESLWKNIGQVVSTEGRSMYNLGRSGLTYWSPNINVVRDPRWGRSMETPGEDPFVVGRYSVNYVRGLQDVEGTENHTDLNTRPLKVSTCCKHYAAYDIEKWNGIERFEFDARVTEQDMEETFLRPFEMCVKEGDSSSLMCSFNNINGIPPCTDPKILNQTVRNDWNLHGYIVSDCDSVEVIHHRQKWLSDTNLDAVAQSFKAGLDLDCGEYYTNFTEPAVQKGLLRETDVDRSLKYLYIVLMRLGYFDGMPQYDSLGKENICTSENIELAVEAARQGIVLLKNENETLPLTSDVKTLAVVGPHANVTNVMIGNYAGVPCKYTSPKDGLSEYAEVDYQPGCGETACNNETLIFPAMRAAKKADATIILIGLDTTIESEGRDRKDLLLPGFQTRMVNQVADAATGPVILVLMSGAPVDISFAKGNDKIKSILWAGYPGQEGGKAIADIVFGKYNPGGRLPMTFYDGNYTDQLPMSSMQLRPDDTLGYPGRTYKFYNGSATYPFGYGLSYTKFSYNLSAPVRSLAVKPIHPYCHSLEYTDDSYTPPCHSVKTEHLTCEDELEFDIEVHNEGSIDGSDVLIVYHKPPQGLKNTYIKQVVGFKRVFVAAGSSEKVNFKLNVCKSLGIVDYNAYKVLAAGGHTLVIGDEAVSFPVQISFS